MRVCNSGTIAVRLFGLRGAQSAGLRFLRNRQYSRRTRQTRGMQMTARVCARRRSRRDVHTRSRETTTAERHYFRELFSTRP